MTMPRWKILTGRLRLKYFKTHYGPAISRPLWIKTSRLKNISSFKNMFGARKPHTEPVQNQFFKPTAKLAFTMNLLS